MPPAVRLFPAAAASHSTRCKRSTAFKHDLTRAASTRRVQVAADPLKRRSGSSKSPGTEAKHSPIKPADSGDRVSYSYHSDGHYKATLEDVFKKSSKATLFTDHAPWSMGWQTNERNIMWNDQLKIRLIKKIVAQKTELSEAALESRLQTLVSLLPDIPARLPSMKPEIVARLLNDRQAVADRLLALKQIFPRADCGKMLVKELGLMSESIESLTQRAEALRDFLPTVDIDRLVQENPSVLSIASFKAAVDDARRLMPGLNIESMMMSDPDFVLSLQKGTDMIPYDAIPENPWGHK